MQSNSRYFRKNLELNSSITNYFFAMTKMWNLKLVSSLETCQLCFFFSYQNVLLTLFETIRSRWIIKLSRSTEYWTGTSEQDNVGKNFSKTWEKYWQITQLCYVFLWYTLWKCMFLPSRVGEDWKELRARKCSKPHRI